MRSEFPNTNLAASTKTANLLGGDINEFVPVASMVTIYGISSASGVRLTVQASQDTVVDDKEITAIGTSLLIPDHMRTQFAVGAGTRLAIYLRETAGAATTDVPLAIDVDPL